MNKLETLKNLISIEQVINMYYPNSKRKGNNLCCPFCGDNMYKFQIYPQTNTFYCHKCHSSNDIIDFVSKLYNIDKKESIKLLSRDFGINFNNNDLSNEVKEKIKNIELKKQQEKLIEKFVLETNNKICEKLYKLRKSQYEINDKKIFNNNKKEIERLELLCLIINDINNSTNFDKKEVLIKIKNGEIKL